MLAETSWYSLILAKTPLSDCVFVFLGWQEQEEEAPPSKKSKQESPSQDYEEK